jgi:hypothetical protein
LGFELGLGLGEAVAFELFADSLLSDLAFHIEGATLLIGTGSRSLLLGRKARRQVVEKTAPVGEDTPAKRSKAISSRGGRGCIFLADALTKLF